MTEPIMAPDMGVWQAAAAISLSPKTQSPPHLSASHWAELVEGSGIDADVAALNFKSWSSAEAEGERQALLAHAFDQLNPQPGHSYQRRLKLQQRYSHLDGGGWRFVGTALPGFAATPRWKPNQPRLGSNGRPIKYEAEPGRRPGPLVPQVGLKQWQAIATSSGLAVPSDRSEGFEAWLLASPTVPLVLVEGEKKACALIGLGLAAVGLAGIELGRQVLERSITGKAIKAELVPELAALAAGGRPVFVCFDAEAKPSTACKVEGAAIRLGHLLAKAGAKVKVVRLPLLPGTDKTGPDDLLVALGRDALADALADALSLPEVAWERSYGIKRRISSTIKLPGATIPKTLELPSAELVAIRAPKGAGKTERLVGWLADRPQVLAITHRRSLGAAMASRLGLIWRNDTDSAMGFCLLADGTTTAGTPPHYALCVDSVLALQPENHRGAVVVLDEVEQVLAHLLTSTTCKDGRGLLIQRFQQLLAVASQVVALDADLSDATLQWLLKAMGPKAKLALVEASQKASGYQVRWYENGIEQAEQALLLAAKRAPVFVTTDSKDRAAALHDLLKSQFPDAKGLLITSATTSSTEVQQWLGKLNDGQALYQAKVQWVVASPSISSGISIENRHFRQVFGFFGAGTFDDAEALQALARVREGVDRHVWVRPVVTPRTKPLSSAWWPQQVEQDLRQRWSTQAAIVRQEFQPDLLLEPSTEQAIEAFKATIELWAELTSRRNYSHSHLRAFIKARLRHEGHRINPPPSSPIELLPEAELISLKAQLRSDNKQAHAEAVASAPAITAAEADRLRRLQQYSPALQRRALLDRLGLAADAAITPEEVIWGEKWAGAAERLACLLEPSLALALDVKRLAATTAKGEAPLPWDQTYKATRQQVAEAIGLRAFIEQFCFEGRSWSSTTAEVVELAQKARQFAKAIEQGLGLRVRSNDKDAALVNSLLISLGITATAKRRDSEARTYAADSQQLQQLQATADRLRQKLSGHTPPSAEKKASPNKTACGGVSPKPASLEQLGLPINGNSSVQLPHRPAASNPPQASGHRAPTNAWNIGGARDRATASSP